LSYDAHCDVCRKKIGYKGIVETTTVVRVAGKEVDRDVYKVPEQSQFNELVRSLRDAGHAIPEGPWFIGGGSGWHSQSQVNCICRECLEKHGVDI
jgi:hypothetical protein